MCFFFSQECQVTRLSRRPYQYGVKFRHKTPVYQLYSRNYYKVIHSKICHNIIKAQVFVNILGRRYARTYKKPGFHSSLNYWHAIALIFPTSLAWAQLQLM